MKRMAHRILSIRPDGTYVTERDVQPLSERAVHAAEVAGWALLTFTVLYLLAHIVATWL